MCRRLMLLAVLVLLPATGADTAEVTGTWQVDWVVRLGTVHATLRLKQDGSRITGTWEDRVSYPVSGSVREKAIVFEVPFSGPRPYTIEFKGTVDGGKMSGTSQLKGGGNGFMGHGGEVMNPDRPWTAIRTPDPSQKGG
jgi:hypothetical protein